MEYFSEIYGDSFRAVAAVLSEAARVPVSERDISRIARQHTSEEEAIYLTDRLTDGTWPLLRRGEDGRFRSVTVNAPAMPLTALQRSWLAAILSDRRCAAFLEGGQREDILRALDTQPLYDCDDVEAVGHCSDPDPYDDPEYARRLGIILDAIEQRRILCISYTGGAGKPIKGDFLPCRLEYSAKDEKLRLYAVFIRYGKVIYLATINLGRIDDIRASRERCDAEIDIDAMRRDARNAEPAVVEITDRRNALERFMLQFSSYEKLTRYIDEEDKYLCSIYYDQSDETELLIRLLSFGPVVKLLSPEPLVAQMHQRIMRQWELLQ